MVSEANWDEIGGTIVKQVVLYTKKHCPLCLEAKMNLMLIGELVPLKIEERDIEEKDEWMEKYGVMIPVVEYNGEIIQNGRVDYPTLLAALK
jgi:glutaredoxin